MVHIGPVKFYALLNANSTFFGCLSPPFIVQKNCMYCLGLISVPVEDGETQGRTHLAYIVYRIMKLNLNCIQLLQLIMTHVI